jgi:RNA polymerase sigma factor (TIGR02999 family)
MPLQPVFAPIRASAGPARFAAGTVAAVDPRAMIASVTPRVPTSTCRTSPAAVQPRVTAGRAMTEITTLLNAASAGDRSALDAVFARLYPELRRLAAAQLGGPERTLSPTVLVNEAYLRLVGNATLTLNDRRHFLATAATAMRAVWVDHARRACAGKRGGGAAHAPLDAADQVAGIGGLDLDILAIDQALGRLDAINPRQREIVELRYFVGLEFAEIAELYGCSERTAKREWERARAFLYATL